MTGSSGGPHNFIRCGLGLLLLKLWLGISESLLFDRAKSGSAAFGNLLALFTNVGRLKKYTRLILLAMHTWYAIGILILFSPELGSKLGLLVEQE